MFVDFLNLLEWAADDKELGSEGAIELVELYSHSHYHADGKVFDPTDWHGVFKLLLACGAPPRQKAELMSPIESLILAGLGEEDGPDPYELIYCITGLAPGSALFSEGFLEQVGDQISRTITANPAQWTVIDLAKLDSALKFPLCSLNIWHMLRTNSPQDLMTAMAEEHLDASRTEWLLAELRTILITNPHLFTVQDLWRLLSTHCGLLPFSQEWVTHLADGACNALLNDPHMLIDVLGIKPWAMAISSLKRASNWPILIRQVLELARQQSLPQNSEVFIALAPPSAAWISDMIKLDCELLASAKVNGQIGFVRLLLTCAEHAAASQKSKAKAFLAMFVAALRQRDGLEALLDDPEMGPLTEMAMRTLGAAPWMDGPPEPQIAVDDSVGSDRRDQHELRRREPHELRKRDRR